MSHLDAPVCDAFPAGQAAQACARMPTARKRPASQFAQAVAPSKALYFPSLHTEQPWFPALALNLPAGHTEHCAARPGENCPAPHAAQPSVGEVAPSVLEAAPGSHVLLGHCTVPPDGAYCPAGQVKHRVWAARGWCLPAGQSRQFSYLNSAPAAELERYVPAAQRRLTPPAVLWPAVNFPEGQFLHGCPLADSKYLPWGQSMQPPPEESLNWPAEQNVQDFWPLPLNCPVAHFAHSVAPDCPWYLPGLQALQSSSFRASLYFPLWQRSHFCAPRWF